MAACSFLMLNVLLLRNFPWYVTRATITREVKFSMFKKNLFADGSTALLILFAAWYFLAYVLTGLAPKIFTGGLFGFAKIPSAANLWYSTIGASGTCLLVVIFLRWPKKFKSEGYISFGSINFPREYLYLGPSGLCTAIVIVTTTMMYMFKGISVMIAMVIMRGCVILIGRAVDGILIRMGVSTKQVTWEENLAVIFAIAAVITAGWKPDDKASLFTNVAAVTTLGLYVTAYFFRILIMTWKKSSIDKFGFFAAEQGFASTTLITLGAVVLFGLSPEGAVADLHHAARTPNWVAILAGVAFGLAAFPSVFLFMFKGRTGTFSALTNRLTSLLAGTVSTLILAALAVGKWPVKQDWVSFVLVLVAVGFLAKKELQPKASQ